jgi:hypothetical protein
MLDVSPPNGLDGEETIRKWLRYHPASLYLHQIHRIKYILLFFLNPFLALVDKIQDSLKIFI